MISKKRVVAVIFDDASIDGGRVHWGAYNIINHVDRNRFDILLVGINRLGEWWRYKLINNSALTGLPGSVSMLRAELVVLVIGNGPARFITLNGKMEYAFDIAFPEVAGAHGQKGTVQGALRLGGVPVVGSDVTAASLDKERQRTLCRAAGIPVPEWITILKSGDQTSFLSISRTLGLPLFVKPSNRAGSVGVAKVFNEHEFRAAVEFAFELDDKVLVEEFIAGRELECGVLGPNPAIASTVGEWEFSGEFFSREAKSRPCRPIVPVSISPEIERKIQELSISAFKALECYGMARVDWFLKDNGDICLNELNIMPTFSANTMFTTLWNYSKWSTLDVINKLLDLAWARRLPINDFQAMQCYSGTRTSVPN